MRKKTAKWYVHPTKNYSMLEALGMGFAFTNSELKKPRERYQKLKVKQIKKLTTKKRRKK